MLGIVADDLTGAGDASVQFARRGWYTLLTLDVRLKPAAPSEVVSGFSRTVVAITTDCRALPNHDAEALTHSAVTALISAGADRLFLKIDSTMRGSVPGQVAGALAAWRMRYPEARAVVCPAYPAMGRTVESNRLLVQGMPVERTAFGRDPVSPVNTSEMATLLPASEHVSVLDAATDIDLIAIAGSILDAGASVIPVGSGGLADALAEVFSRGADPGPAEAGHYVPDNLPLQPDPHILRLHSYRDLVPHRKNPRILLQVSSLNPVSHAQVARLKGVFPDVVVLLPPAERGDNTAVARDLARAFAEQVEREPWDLLGLIGGDGARETLAQLGASGVRILDSLLEGIPLGLVVGGDADGTPVFTKAGGFGAEDALVRIVERIRGDE